MGNFVKNVHCNSALINPCWPIYMWFSYLFELMIIIIDVSAERVSSLGKDWHRPCLKCEKCNKTLSAGSHAEVSHRNTHRLPTSYWDRAQIHLPGRLNGVQLTFGIF